MRNSITLRLGLAAVALALLGAGAAHAGMLSPGASMPHFELRDQEGRMVSSNDLAGKRYLLWFYPKAMTPGCTIEAKSLRDNYSTLEKAGVVVLGVSFDEPASNKQFVAAEALPFRLLSDTDRKLAVAVGAAESTDAKTARRISYLVGADGKIEKAYDNVDPNVHAGQVVSDCSANGK
ncbi:MAG TPA: peroxiredoxin [Candidatus Limnocylindrales bacterium]|nr:peroxiredoxin [Candidatus Limnocylindrales bacterium]